MQSESSSENSFCVIETGRCGDSRGIRQRPDKRFKVARRLPLIYRLITKFAILLRQG